MTLFRTGWIRDEIKEKNLNFFLECKWNLSELLDKKQFEGRDGRLCLDSLNFHIDEISKFLINNLDFATTLYNHKLFPLDKIHLYVKYACIGYNISRKIALNNILSFNRHLIDIINDYL
jgi:hypothetical protein